jgi:hypothetical protein
MNGIAKMNEIELQRKSIEALKSFNNAIVTSRLYPPDAPQVANAVDIGYKGIKLFLKDQDVLEFSLLGGTPMLSRLPLQKTTLDSFPNLVVYRQLRLLGLSMLAVRSEMDRFAFNQLLTVFTASVEKIKNGGGGIEFITSLGLASYFPQEAGLEEGAAGKVNSNTSRSRIVVKVRSELVACLFGRDKRPVVQAELQEKLATTDTAVEILCAGVAHILQEIQEKKIISASRYFPIMMKEAESQLETANRNEVAMGLGKLLTESLNDPAKCVLFSQEYPPGFGSSVYDGLMTFLSSETIGNLVALFREQHSKAKLTGGDDSSQVQFLGKAMVRLLDTEKGKHFLSAEKARTIIEQGEKARKQERLEGGIQGLLQGKTDVLKSVELVQHLAATVRILLKNNRVEDVSIILEGIAVYLRTGIQAVQNDLLEASIVIGENLIAYDHWNLVDVVLKPLMEKVEKAVSGDMLLEQTVTLLHQVMQHSWHTGENERGDRILTLFHQIRSGQLPKPSSISSMVGIIQDKGIQRTSLPKLLGQCLESPNNTTFNYRLILQGPVAVRFLVDSLMSAQNAADRIKIIDLLTYSDTFLPPVIMERLPEHMPWYGKRNLIKLLGETGKEEDAESVLPYLRYDDFRVQREAFLCIYKIGGKNRKQLLLSALDECSELIKIQIIAALAKFCDQEVALQLSDLLLAHEQFSDTGRNTVLSQLLDTLGRCPCPAAQKGIQKFLRSRGGRATRKIPEQVWYSAEKSLKYLERELQETRKRHVQASQLRKNALKQAANLSQATASSRVITGLPQEQTIRNLLSKGDKGIAGEQVLQLIERMARLRSFIQADKLREWLIDIDPTAFNQIIRAAEIIDREKAAAIDKSHLEIWSRLYDILSTGEFSAVYHSLTHRKIKTEEVIVHQGALQGSLYFINSGKVKLYFEGEGHELLVKTMESGEIFGADAFFEASIWTISVASIGTSDISVLKLDNLKKCDEDFPGLEEKLRDFCQQFERVEDFIARSSNDRRIYVRHKISGEISTTLLDNKGRSTGVNSGGELSDISEGGMSYQVKISRKANARLLLGRKVEVTLPTGRRTGDFTLVVGDILAVKSNLAVDSDYSVHVKFDTLIDQNQLREIVQAGSIGSRAI